jgi:pantoate--beta-alanine ligase
VKGEKKEECVRRARGVIQSVAEGGEAKERGVSVKLDYVEMNDAGTFEVVGDGEVTGIRNVLLSGAIWVGKTRLIDNVILGDVGKILG